MLRRVSGFPPFFPLPGKSEYNFSIIKKKWNKFREFRSGTLFRYTNLELRLFLFTPCLPLIDNLAPKCPGIFLCVLLQTNAPWSDGDLGRLGGSARMATLAWQGIERFSVRLNQPAKTHITQKRSTTVSQIKSSVKPAIILDWKKSPPWLY